tara:strand:+ start:5161 stop:5289 length:129 start_codon:yes stop_codon:yes gene_type:complete
MIAMQSGKQLVPRYQAVKFSFSVGVPVVIKDALQGSAHSILR